MLRAALIPIIFLAFRAGAPAQTGRQDYTDELLELTQLTDNRQYREALNGYRRLAGAAGTPAWLRAASEYEIAELYGALGEADNAIAALGRAIQLGFDDCMTPRASERLGTALKNPQGDADPRGHEDRGSRLP
jgi:hypothetical protein